MGSADPLENPSAAVESWATEFNDVYEKKEHFSECGVRGEDVK